MYELDWLGYKSVKNELRLDAKSLASVWQSFVWNDKNPGKWRSDYDDLHTQFAYEIARHALPEICKNFSERGAEIDLRRFFLFQDVISTIAPVGNLNEE